MIHFEKMGKLEYLVKYLIDKDTKTIRKMKAYINNIANVKDGVYITSELDLERISPLRTAIYTNHVYFCDNSNNFHHFEFYTHYIMRLDLYIEYIQRLYRTKVNNESVKLDYYQYHYYNSSNKTENEYQVPIGTITSYDNNEIYITVDKNNGVIKNGRDIFIKPVTVNEGKVKFENQPLEIFTISDNGIMHLKDQHIYHDYFFNSVSHHTHFSNLYVAENNLLENLPMFYLNHQTVEIEYPEYSNHKIINVNYDCYGIMKSDDSDNPIIYDDFYLLDNDTTPVLVQSIHPIYIDHNNINVRAADELYAYDYIETRTGYGYSNSDDCFLVIREVRNLDKYNRSNINEHIKHHEDIIDVDSTTRIERFFANIESEFHC